MIKIDKNVAIPPGGWGTSATKYPWRAMDVGDSFLVEGLKETAPISAAAAPYGRRHNKKFTVRKVDGGVRVWRIE